MTLNDSVARGYQVVVVSALSHGRVALDGDATPSPLGRLVTVHGSGFIASHGPAAVHCNISSTDSVEAIRGFAYDAEHVLQVERGCRPANLLSQMCFLN